MLQVTDEGAIEAFIPVRYPAPRNDEERLARRTEWVELGDDLYMGYGQKCLVTDADPIGYLDVRELTVRSREPAAPATA
jgi:type VI secretion system protein ImpE